MTSTVFVKRTKNELCIRINTADLRDAVKILLSGEIGAVKNVCPKTGTCDIYLSFNATLCCSKSRATQIKSDA